MSYAPSARRSTTTAVHRRPPRPRPRVRLLRRAASSCLLHFPIADEQRQQLPVLLRLLPPFLQKRFRHLHSQRHSRRKLGNASPVIFDSSSSLCRGGGTGSNATSRTPVTRPDRTRGTRPRVRAATASADPAAAPTAPSSGCTRTPLRGRRPGGPGSRAPGRCTGPARRPSRRSPRGAGAGRRAGRQRRGSPGRPAGAGKRAWSSTA
jgi:hypothetical protein